MPLYIEETWIDATRHCNCGSSDVYEAFTDNVGELYRSLRHEYGRCTSRVYIDKPDGSYQPVGWVFLKRRRYEDSPETYLAETWVTVHEKPPTRTIEHHYARV